MVLATTIKQNLHYDKYSLLAMYYNAGEVKLQSLSSTHSMQLLSLVPLCTLVLWSMLHSGGRSVVGSTVSLQVAKKSVMQDLHANIEACRYA